MKNTTTDATIYMYTVASIFSSLAGGVLSPTGGSGFPPTGGVLSPTGGFGFPPTGGVLSPTGGFCVLSSAGGDGGGLTPKLSIVVLIHSR